MAAFHCAFLAYIIFWMVYSNLAGWGGEGSPCPRRVEITFLITPLGPASVFLSFLTTSSISQLCAILERRGIGTIARFAFFSFITASLSALPALAIMDALPYTRYCLIVGSRHYYSLLGGSEHSVLPFWVLFCGVVGVVQGRLQMRAGAKKGFFEWWRSRYLQSLLVLAFLIFSDALAYMLMLILAVLLYRGAARRSAQQVATRSVRNPQHIEDAFEGTER